MYINNIRKFVDLKKSTLKEVAENIGKTENGFYLALKNDTLKVKDLKKIADFLKVDIAAFFRNPDEIQQSIEITGENSSTHIAETITEYRTQDKARIKELEKELELSNKEKDLLRKEIDMQEKYMKKMGV